MYSIFILEIHHLHSIKSPQPNNFVHIFLLMTLKVTKKKQFALLLYNLQFLHQVGQYIVVEIHIMHMYTNKYMYAHCQAFVHTAIYIHWKQSISPCCDNSSKILFDTYIHVHIISYACYVFLSLGWCCNILKFIYKIT